MRFDIVNKFGTRLLSITTRIKTHIILIFKLLIIVLDYCPLQQGLRRH